MKKDSYNERFFLIDSSLLFKFCTKTIDIARYFYNYFLTKCQKREFIFEKC